MNNKKSDIDRRIAAILHESTDEAARRVPGLWPVIAARRSRGPVRRRWIWAAVPICAAVITVAVLLTPGWLTPVPDVLSTQPTAVPASLAPAPDSEIPLTVGGVILTAGPSRYSPLMSSAFGIHIAAADSRGNPVTGEWSATWGYFLPAVQSEGGWRIGEPQDEMDGVSDVYWSFMSDEIPDSIKVSFDDGNGPVTITLERDPGSDYFVRIAGPQQDPVSVEYTFGYQAVQEGIGILDPVLITDEEQMKTLCRDIVSQNTHGDGGYIGGKGFILAFRPFIENADSIIQDAGTGGITNGGRDIRQYDPSVFESNDLIVFSTVFGSSAPREVRMVARAGDVVTVTVVSPDWGDTEMETMLFIVEIPKGVADGAAITAVYEYESDWSPTPQPTVAPDTTYNAFGLPADEMVPMIVDEYGMLIPDWQEIVALQCASNNREAPDFNVQHPAWPAWEAGLTWDDLILWDTPLETGRDEALASIEAAMKRTYGQTLVRTADETGENGIRTVEWADGTKAVFAEGVLYSLETISSKGAMLPGLAVGGSIAWFIEAYGAPRIDESGGVLSWSIGNNPLGNDHLFITARDGIVTSIRISLIQ